MADITMCKGDGCPKREECYRHTAPQNQYRQSWFADSPLKSAEPFDCEWFTDNHRRREVTT